VIKEIFLLLVGLGTITGCNKNQKYDRESGRWTIPTVSEDILVNRLAPHLLIEAQDSNQHNPLIEHIYDQSWDMEFYPPGIFGSILSSGSSQKPKWGDRVLVHYNGYKLDGTLFDSSIERNKPFRFFIGNVIDGWNQVLPLLGSGGRGVFIIPFDLAYGSKGFKTLVGPNEHLLFEIELLEIEELLN